MKASVMYRIWIMLQAVTTTQSISVLALYMRLRGTYDRPYADGVLRRWSQGLLRTVRATYEVIDPHRVTIEAGTPYIIMSNHRSLYDIPLIFMSLPGSIRMLTKKELFQVPLWGRGLRASEFLSIDRRNHDQALKDMEVVKHKMQTGIVVWIAPEGTRSRNGRLGEFKKGGFMIALQTGATIIPVGVRGSERITPPDTFDFCLDRHVEVHIGAPIDARRYSLETRDAFMQDVRQAILTLSGEE